MDGRRFRMRFSEGDCSLRAVAWMCRLARTSDHGPTQARLSELMTVGPRTWQGVEAGRRYPQLCQISVLRPVAEVDANVITVGDTVGPSPLGVDRPSTMQMARSRQ